MPTAPLKTSQIPKVIHSRPPLKEATERLTFESHLQSTKPGVRVFPPPVGGTVLERPAKTSAADEKSLQGFLPDHLALNPAAPYMDEHLRIRRTYDPLAKLKKNQFMATTIFPPDQRRVFSDTSFPWCTVGRVEVTGGWGSGTLIGPRHLLCASHMMTWNPDNTVNQVTLTPSYFNGNAPFGNSGIIHWYAYRKVVGPILSAADTEEDYVVLVLNNRLGDICGWMGTRGYDGGWNGLPDWSHIGYPQDIAGGTEPTFQNAISIDNNFGGSDDEYLAQKADVIPGQSGGPFFGWWAGEAWPRVVGVQSAQNPSTNSAGGGNDIPNLVNQARADFL